MIFKIEEFIADVGHNRTGYVSNKKKTDFNGLTPQVVYIAHALSLGLSGLSGPHTDGTGLGACFHDF